MGDSDEKNTEPAAPAWQTASTADSKPQTPSDITTLDQARKFLEDEEVRSSSREKKVEFLKSKGLVEADITTLLDGTEAESTKAVSQPPGEPNNAGAPTFTSTDAQQFETRSEHAPIITYPEFLTKPTKPPPLITATGLFNSLGIVAGVSTLVYGATKYIVGPMVDSLIEARIDFHENTNKNLSTLVEKLEQTVSEIPTIPTKKTLLDADDDDSSYDDPHELYHRDIGVQTSPPTTPGDFWGSEALATSMEKPNAAKEQAAKLASLVLSIRSLTEDFTAQAEDYGETKTVLNMFNENLNSLAYPPESFGMGSAYLYGPSKEPDDEIKKAKDNIKRMKGVLLSTSNFPTSRRGIAA